MKAAETITWFWLPLVKIYNVGVAKQTSWRLKPRHQFFRSLRYSHPQGGTRNVFIELSRNADVLPVRAAHEDADTAYHIH